MHTGWHHLTVLLQPGSHALSSKAQPTPKHPSNSSSPMKTSGEEGECENSNHTLALFALNHCLGFMFADSETSEEECGAHLPHLL